MALDKTGLTRFWQHIVSRLDPEVDKIEGKGLSTNDFTTEEKNKLAIFSPAKTITLSGAVSGTASFDENGDAALTTSFPENISIPGTITANKVIGAVYM